MLRAIIPVSNEALEDCHYKASKDLLCMYLNNKNSWNVSRKSLRLGGSSQIVKTTTHSLAICHNIDREHAYVARI
jgi:predicted GH43/DUF377 family glycosyl hydrolase